MLTRRQILQSTSSGFGYLAFAGISAAQAANEAARNDPLAAKTPHFEARAKRVIFLCMQGGPSHVDSFDYKPALTKDHGKPGKYGGSLLKSPWQFRQRGKSGLWISDLFPNVAEQADQLTLIRSMQCDQPLHPGAMTQLHTGTAQFLRPSLGAWSLYGLGTENDSLPGFIALKPSSSGSRNFGSAFLPAIYSGTKVGRSSRVPQRAARGGTSESVADIKNPALSKQQQRTQLDLIQALNREKLRRDKVQPGVDGIIESYELAFRMQDAMPALMDTSKETQATLSMYGADGGPTEDFGMQCLRARRFVEAGVRFVELGLTGWDSHSNLSEEHKTRAEMCDKPIAGLLHDLKQRDLLKDTLVIWCGEFGRTPAAQSGDGRNHNNKGYTSWMAGGGVKGGFSYGMTDEHGFEAVEDKCHIHDFHATILHLLGLDHERLTYRYAGRDFRLTDVHGKVAEDILV
ncbi:MAG: sulfatase [Planctomycetaceae bacterium]|nr:sulfatase [Planctomycetaceae bacterium]